MDNEQSSQLTNGRLDEINGFMLNDFEHMPSLKEARDWLIAEYELAPRQADLLIEHGDRYLTRSTDPHQLTNEAMRAFTRGIFEEEGSLRSI